MAVVSAQRGFKPVFNFRSEISTFGAVRKEFEHLYAALDALFDTFFNSDGTHKPITTTQVTIQQNTELNNTTNPLTIINQSGSTVTAAGLDTWIQFNEKGNFGARIGARWIYENAANLALGVPAAATVANTGAGAYAATLRYYKVQWYTVAAGVVTAQSELGAVVSFTPSGTGTAARVTRPGITSTAITHWQVYGSANGTTFVAISSQIAIATTTYDDSVAPGSYSGASPLTAGAYTTELGQLRLTTDDNPFTQLSLLQSGGGTATSRATTGWMPFSSSYQEVLYNMIYENGNYIATSTVCFVKFLFDGDQSCGWAIYPGQTPGSAVDFTTLRTINFRSEGIDISNGIAAGDPLGATGPGRRLTIQNNSDGSGAAGALILARADGTLRYLWVDATDDLRIGSAAPTADGGVSDTSGTVVGTQT